MENKTYYGILMYKINLDLDIYMFKPQHLVEGTIEVDKESEQQFFQEKNGMQYLMMTDTTVISDSLDNCVGFILTEEELLEKYPDFDIYRAREAYLEQILEYSHIGFYHYKEDKIKMIEFPFRYILKCVNESDYEEYFNFDFENDDKKISSAPPINEMEYVFFRINTLRELAVSSQPERIQKFMQEIYNEYLLIAKQNQNQDIDISKQFESLVNSNNLEEMQNCINIIIDYVGYLYCSVDDIKFPNVDSQKHKDYLILIDNFFQDLKLKDERDIKEIVSLFKDQVVKNLKIIDRSVKQYAPKKEQEPIQEQILPDIQNKNALEMKNFFDERIIGLDEAKKSVITTIMLNEYAPSKRKNSSLLIGPTGSGKTFLIEVAQEYLDVPLEIVDITQITVAGYVGENIEDFLARLLKKANGNLERAEHGIVVFNELDKKGSSSNNDVAGRGVLNSLLTFMEGTKYHVVYNNQKYDFDTSNLTIFATGAFQEVYSLIKKRNLGFNQTLVTENGEISYQAITREDLSKHGEIPMELLGRFTTILTLPHPTVESLKKILAEAKYSPLFIKKEIYEKLNIQLSWMESYLYAVAKKALKLNTGARALNAIVEETLKEAEWLILTNPDLYTEMILDGESVENNKLCKLKNIDGEIYTIEEIISDNLNELRRKRSLKGE